METILICGWMMFVQPKAIVESSGELKNYWFYSKVVRGHTITLWLDKPNICVDDNICVDELLNEEVDGR